MEKECRIAYFACALLFVVAVAIVFAVKSDDSNMGSFITFASIGVGAGVFRSLMSRRSDTGEFDLRGTDEGLCIGSEVIVPWELAGSIEAKYLGPVKGE